MSGVIAKAIAPTLRKLKKYIADLPMLRNEEGKSMVKNDFPRYVRHVKDILNLMKGAVLCLKEQNELWIKLIYALQGEDRSKEEKMYDEMTKDPEGMIQVCCAGFPLTILRVSSHYLISCILS
uniref:RPW8 domain-containing protein n=1 Tax=Syphacia muris TaxID=451379 RepID=A0A0N5AVT6_9BILA